MDLLKKLEIEHALEEKALGQRTLLSDAELQELEEQIQSQANQELKERELFMEELENDINTARQYLHIRSWKKSLEILKHLFENKNIPSQKQKEIHNLYFEANALMEAARATDPNVPKFTHFNLPTNDAN